MYTVGVMVSYYTRTMYHIYALGRAFFCWIVVVVVGLVDRGLYNEKCVVLYHMLDGENEFHR